MKKGSRDGLPFLAVLVETAGGVADLVGHFEVEEFFEEGGAFDVGKDVGELGETQVAAVAEDVEDATAEGRDVVLFEVERLLDGLRMLGRLPVHGIEEVLGRGDQTGTVEADETVAAVAAVVGDATGEREDVASVVEGDGGGDERAAFLLAFSHEDGIGQTCDDAVAGEEVAAFERSARDIFGEETAALLDHLLGYATVVVGVDAVEAVGYDAEGRDAVFEGCLVRLDIDAEGQSADDDDVGERLVQLLHETMNDVAAVLRALACADNADDVFGLEVNVAKLEEDSRGIGTAEEALGIALLTIDERPDVVGFDEVEFATGVVEELGVLTAIDDPLADSTGLLEQGGLGLEDGFG